MRRFPLSIGLTVAAGLTLSAVLVARAWREGAPTAPAGVQPPGMVIYRDPVTGKLAEPPPGLLDSQANAIAPQAAGGWRQSPPDRAGGGWKLDGPGLMQRMTATVGPDGKVTLDCAPVHPGTER
jgi:hypothetical protein